MSALPRPEVARVAFDTRAKAAFTFGTMTDQAQNVTAKLCIVYTHPHRDDLDAMGHG